MITLSELKLSLNINDNSKNDYLLNLIDRSITEFETLTNRTYLYNDSITEYVLKNQYSDRVYLNVNPIREITTIQYYSGADEGYIDLIDSPDTIADSLEVFEEYILLRNGYSALDRDLKFVYSGGYKFGKGTGTIAVNINSASVTGTSTLFTTELAENDTLIIDSEIKKVSSISTATALTLTSPARSNHYLSNYYYTNCKEDIRKAILMIAMNTYNSSNTTYTEIKEGFEASLNLPNPNLENIINHYRKVNI